MRNLLTLLVASLLVLTVVPGVLAVNVGTGIGVDIVTEDFEPRVWMCDSRVVYDDNTEPGRQWPNNDCNTYSGDQDGQNDCHLLERINNYAFEGEQISWRVLVFDKNGIDKIEDVFVSVGPTQGAGNDIEANCQLTDLLDADTPIHESCNARILEEELDTPGYDNVAGYYDCLFTVETPLSMYDEHFVTVEAVDLDGLSGTMDENEYWFFNPVVALDIQGDLIFDNVRPGTDSYSETLLIENAADIGSGVMMDMFISGTDFYDSTSSGAKCPTTNQLALQNFRYFATNGAYSTSGDNQMGRAGGDGNAGTRDKDAEGYVDIGYGIGFNDPHPFYDGYEVLQAGAGGLGPYYPANILAPGAEMALTFKLSLPEPCNGDFDTGSIYFWGEAI